MLLLNNLLHTAKNIDILCVVETWDHALSISPITKHPKWKGFLYKSLPHPDSKRGSRRGGTAIFYKEHFKNRINFLNTPSSNPATLWATIAGKSSTHALGVTYSRPGHPNEHSQIMADITSDTTWLRTEWNPDSFLLLGDYNSHLGTMTGDNKTPQQNKDYAFPFTKMLHDCNLTVLKFATRNENKLAKTFGSQSDPNQSFVDLLISSNPEELVSRKKSRPNDPPVTIHTDIQLEGDHNLLETDWLITSPPDQDVWGDPNPSPRHKPLSETEKCSYRKLTNESKDLQQIRMEIQTALKTTSCKGQNPARENKLLNRLTQDIIQLTHVAIHKAQGKPLPASKSNRKRKRTKNNKENEPNPEHANAALLQKRNNILVQLSNESSLNINQDDLWSKVKCLSKQIKNLDQKAENKRIKALFEPLLSKSNTQDPSPNTLWKIFKDITSTEATTFPTLFKEPGKKPATGSDAILKLFCKHLNEVSNSTDKDGLDSTNNLTAAQRNLQANNLAKSKSKIKEYKSLGVQDLLSSSCQLDQEDWEVVTKRITSKTNTATGPHNESYEMFLHGGQLLQDTILDLFKLFFKTGITPSFLQNSYLVLLHKKGPKTDVTNYRPITLSSCLLKMYEMILESRIMKFLSTKNPMLHTTISRLQGVCKKGKGAIEQIIDLAEIAAQNPNIILCAFDLSKAFDRINQSQLFQKLHNMGIQGRLWLAVLST